MEGIAYPAIPLGRVQRLEPDPVRCAKHQPFADQFQQLRKLHGFVDQPARDAVRTAVRVLELGSINVSKARQGVVFLGGPFPLYRNQMLRGSLKPYIPRAASTAKFILLRRVRYVQKIPQSYAYRSRPAARG